MTNVLGREGWAHYIRERAERWLYLRSGIEWEATPLSPEVEVFAERLAEHDLQTVFRLHHLSHPATQEFLRTHLGILLRTAARSTFPRLEFSRTGARGRVAWAETFRARLAGRSDAATIAFRRPFTSADVPENQLLKFYLAGVARMVGELEDAFGTTSVPTAVRDAGRMAKAALKEMWLREIPLARALTVRMRATALRNRNPSYKVLLERADEFNEALVLTRRAAILRLIAAGWLRPIASEDLLELFALVLVLDVLETDCAFELQNLYGLVRPGAKGEVATFRRGDVRVSVTFDSSPKGHRSEYVDILSRYEGLPDGHRPRPDITLSFVGKRQTNSLIVEVKEAQSEQYARSSVYKALGYLKDYPTLWPDSAIRPKVVLLFPDDIRPIEERSPYSLDVAAIGTVDRVRLAKIINAVTPAAQ